MKKTLKYVPKASDVKPITLDAFRLAGFDLFELIVDMDKLMHAYGMPTIQFISDVFSSTTKYEQLGYVIDNTKHTNALIFFKHFSILRNISVKCFQ